MLDEVCIDTVVHPVNHSTIRDEDASRSRGARTQLCWYVRADLQL